MIFHMKWNRLNTNIYSLPLKASSSAGPSNTKVLDHFISMGFPGEVVSKVIQEYGQSTHCFTLFKCRLLDFDS